MKNVGNAANSKLNMQWTKHVRKFYKRYTSKRRRLADKKEITNSLIA